VRAGRPDLPLEPEALADDIGQPRQDLRQIASGLFLQQHRGGEKPYVQQRNAFGEITQSRFERRSQVLFVEQRAELLAQRVRQLLTTICRVIVKACPARMERDRKSSASGNCSSNVSKRFLRFFRT